MEYLDYAKEAISFYSISYQGIEFIRHNENMIFKIMDDLHNKAYVLRIHSSNIKGLSGVQHTYEGLKSEMEFLHYLSKFEVLKTQIPVANCRDEYVTTFYNDDFSTPIFTTLLEWVEGVSLTLKEDNLEELIFAFGEKVAILHEASRLFRPSIDFVRPVYNVDNLETAIHDLKYGIDIGVFNANQYALMVRVVNKVINKITELDERSGAWGIIHADFQLNNIIINNGDLSFIDFGLSGYGYYLFDLGSAATILDSPLRNNFFNGYASRTTFSFDDLQFIECLIFADVFISYVLFIHDEKNRGWIKGHADNMCENLYEKFLEGESVFNSL
jgi:Ser/Thr protein kinase RdoA (MazF antagonist)